MGEHGARVLAIERPVTPAPEAPYEIHRLEFPTRAAFAAYRADVRLAAFRERAIRRTEVTLAGPAL